MLLQANDYRWLHEHEGCELQIGGSDQWGNITAGVDLIRRSTGAAVHALTWPLITAPTARSSARRRAARSGSTRTAPARTSSSSTGCRPTTAQVAPVPVQFTLLPVERDRRASWPTHEAAPERREAQRVLAREVDGAGPRRRRRRRPPRRPPRSLFGGAGRRARPPAALEAVLRRGRRPPASPRPSSTPGLDLVDLLRRTGAGGARRARPAGRSSQGGVYVNGERAPTRRADSARSDLLHGRCRPAPAGASARPPASSCVGRG